jgi:hypothetical protein
LKVAERMSMSEWRRVKNRDEITMDTFTQKNSKDKKKLSIFGKYKGTVEWVSKIMA